MPADRRKAMCVLCPAIMRIYNGICARGPRGLLSQFLEIRTIFKKKMRF
jgi:hypothetical protein